MHESFKNIIAAIIAIAILTCCKTNSTIVEDEYSETELMVVTDYEDSDVDTIPDPFPDEPEIPEEEPDEEPEEDPEEEPEPIPDTLFIWK